jgi:hypothetical protein
VSLDQADAIKAATYLAEVLASQVRYRQAVDDLHELGITASPADALAWLTMSAKEREQSTVLYAMLLAAREPAWKGR